jgi:transglutaminase-like putative cysteine protease
VKHGNTLALISALTGAGLLIVGGIAHARRNAGVAGLGWGRGRRVYGRAAEAPEISRFSDGNMTTVLREQRNMPIEVRVASIQKAIEKSIQDPKMREISLRATAHCPERDGACEARAIYDFIKARVRYTGDIAPIRWSDGTVEGVDLFQAARRTLEFGGGDCDDHNIVASTMLAHNGITPRLRVVKTRSAPDWEHIFTGALLPKGTGDKFIALDTTLPGNEHFGREPSYHKFVDFDA